MNKTVDSFCSACRCVAAQKITLNSKGKIMEWPSINQMENALIMCDFTVSNLCSNNCEHNGCVCVCVCWVGFRCIIKHGHSPSS